MSPWAGSTAHPSISPGLRIRWVPAPRPIACSTRSFADCCPHRWVESSRGFELVEGLAKPGVPAGEFVVLHDVPDEQRTQRIQQGGTFGFDGAGAGQAVQSESIDYGDEGSGGLIGLASAERHQGGAGEVFEGIERIGDCLLKG